MLRLISLTCFFVLTLSAWGCAEDFLPQDVEDFLATRKLLVTVPFAAGSTSLSASAQKILEQSLSALRDIDVDRYQLRIEGFTSPEGGAELNVNLAMERAREVELFLRKFSGLSANRTLTGIGVAEGSGLDPDQQRRVEIVRYDNIGQFDKLPTEKISFH